MLTTKRGYDKAIFKIQGTVIRLADDIRYLGVQLNSIIGYRKHIEVTSEKPTKTSSALARLMPNVGSTIPAKIITYQCGSLTTSICCADLAISPHKREK